MIARSVCKWCVILTLSIALRLLFWYVLSST